MNSTPLVWVRVGCRSLWVPCAPQGQAGRMALGGRRRPQGGQDSMLVGRGQGADSMAAVRAR